MRKSSLYLSATLLCMAALIYLLCIHSAPDTFSRKKDIAAKRELVARLQLTDLCLFTEARYTRHLSQSDLYSAFQDHPMSFEHFPSGSLTMPPAALHMGSQH